MATRGLVVMVVLWLLGVEEGEALVVLVMVGGVVVVVGRAILLVVAVVHSIVEGLTGVMLILGKM